MVREIKFGQVSWRKGDHDPTSEAGKERSLPLEAGKVKEMHEISLASLQRKKCGPALIS